MSEDEKGITWESELLKRLPVTLILVSIALLSITLYRKNKPGDWTNELKNSKSINSKSKSVSTNDSLKNIWQERQKNGTAEESTFQKTDAQDKPFGSSYYYAHNDSSRTGGYKDGLKMEDYAMNGPRLLKKNGVDVKGMEQPTKATATTAAAAALQPAPKTRRVTAAAAVAPIPITKYLWDDPGDPKGIATIRIESLPGPRGSSNEIVVDWKDANVKDIKANLINDNKSLSVVITTDDDTTYRLLLPQLYGDVDSVKRVSKEKRLLIRLYKSLTGEKAAEAWPHPYSKIS